MSGSATAHQVAFRVLRQPSAIGHLNTAIARWLGVRSVPELAVGAVQVVLDELIGNLLQHDPDNIDPVEVELRLDDSMLAVRLSYRAADFRQSNRGLLLDHILVTPGLREAAFHTGKVQARIHDDVRGWDKPSDHAPVTADLMV